MPEISPSNLKPRESNVVERAYFEVQYGIAALAKSTKGITSLQNPNQALADIAVVRERLITLEAACQVLADAASAEKAASRALIDAAEKASRDEAKRLARNEARRVARVTVAPVKKSAPKPEAKAAPITEARLVLDEPILPEPVEDAAPTRASFRTLFAGMKRRMAA
jgi:hypothetical protein